MSCGPKGQDSTAQGERLREALGKRCEQNALKPQRGVTLHRSENVPQSLAHILVHVIFSTKNRAPYLSTPQLREAMNGYMVGTLRNLNSPSIITNCVDDHLHCLCHMARTISVAKLVEEMKTSSSAWIKTQPGGPSDFHWQNGYGAFSVSPSNVPQMKAYIANQEEHHRRVSFQEKFREFLRRHGVEWDERYVWD
jgi:REP element-mobilizing transposase RayT